MSFSGFSIFLWTLVLPGLVNCVLRRVDLSWSVNEEIPIYPTLEKFLLKAFHNGTKDGYWYYSDYMTTSTHIGTHLDAPCHFAKDRWCVSDIPLDHLIAPAILVDIRSKVGDNADYALTIDDLEEWEKEHGHIPDGSVLLVLTGWGRYWHDPSKYLGSTENNLSNLHFPAVSHETAKWLADKRNIVGIGLDAVSIDPGYLSESNLYFKTHTILSDRNVFILENVAHLEELPPTGTLLYALPMKIDWASGAPARVVAVLGSSPSAPESNPVAAPLTLLTTLLFLL